MYTPIEKLFETANYITDQGEKDLILKAYEIGKRVHSDQLRKSGEPYFNHCVATAINIAGQSMDYETICAGLLHDSLEDTDYKEDDMRKDFGETITRLVQGVTKLGHVKYSGAERHVESLRKFFIAMSDDIRVVIIKLCDRLHNMRTLDHVRPDKQKRIALETLEIHARLADRLGMGRLKAQLEDCAFPYVYPEEYARVKNLLSSATNNSEKTLKEVADNLKEELNILDVHIESVDSRVKHLYSLWQKLKKNDYDMSKIYDVIALRIIVPNVSDCYLALGVIHGLYRPIPGRFKDYIAVPKPNGYKSLHTAIFTGTGDLVEVQIRTREMHEEAEYGVASHLSYKEQGKENISNKISKKTKWTADLLAWQKETEKESEDKDDNKISNDIGKESSKKVGKKSDSKSDSKSHEKFMAHLKEDFFNHRVFVFTPKGDVIDLPEGSTPLDFAYQVHSDIGDHALRAYASAKLVPFDYILKNHDRVRIETSEHAKPNRKWINICKTQLAKRHVRSWIKNHGGIIDKFLVK